MSPLQRHWLEKLQVQVAGVGALAIGWFACWHLIKPWQPHGAISFLPHGDYAGLAVYAATAWGLSAACALMTLSARPEGALVATLAGMAGLGLRSGPMRMLLWQQQDPARLFSLLALETLALGAVLAGAAAIVALVRAAGRKALGRWVWSEPEAEADGGEAGPRRRQVTMHPAVQMAGAGLMEMALALILLVYTFRSTDRGQVAFALAASFFLAALAAHCVFPIRRSLPFWLGPIVMALAVFSLGSTGVAPTSGPTWHSALMVARDWPLRAALPVDWLAMGGAGATAGFWISRRMHDARGLAHEPEGKTQSA